MDGHISGGVQPRLMLLIRYLTLGTVNLTLVKTLSQPRLYYPLVPACCNPLSLRTNTRLLVLPTPLEPPAVRWRDLRG